MPCRTKPLSMRPCDRMPFTVAAASASAGVTTVGSCDAPYEEKADGCTNALLPEYVEWCSTDANEYIVEDTTQSDPTQNTDGLSQELIDKGLHYNEEGALVDANGNYSMDNDDDLYEGSQNGITGPDDIMSNEAAHENGLAVHEMFNGEQAQEIHDKMAAILGRG